MTDSTRRRARLFTTARLVLATTIVVLVLGSAPAAAHGVDVVAELDDRTAELELTDETGEVCLRFDSTIGSDDQISIAAVSADDPALELGTGFDTEKRCQLLDPDTVDAVLADVDGYELVRREPDGTVTRGQLAKPLPPASETALTEIGSADEQTDSADESTDGPSLPAVFAIGAALGITIVVVRKRLGR